MITNRIFQWSFAILFTLAALMPAANSRAGSGRITRGDAKSVFRTFSSGIAPMLFFAGNRVAAPAQGWESAAILPIADISGDKHYCVDDWHAVMVAVIYTGDATLSYQEAEESLNAITISFLLDGLPVSSTRTAISRWLLPEVFGGEEAYAFTQGRVLSPSELSVGEHSLTLQWYDEISGEFFSDSITFYVDPSSSSTCTN